MRPAVFLDRDGTLIHDRHYLAEAAGVELLSGAAEAVARLNEARLAVVLVTNQSGIGRGLFTEDDYARVHARLVRELARAGAHLDGAYHCPDAADSDDPDADRKPGAGMFLRAARELALDLPRSWLVGDRVRDVAPAGRLGARAVLVRGPKTEPPGEARLPWVHEAGSLAEAVEHILRATGTW